MLTLFNQLSGVITRAASRPVIQCRLTFSQFLGLLVLLLTFTLAGNVRAFENVESSSELERFYQRVLPTLESNELGVPLYIESTMSEGAARGRISGLIPASFEQVATMLTSLSDWCDVSTLHTNIKTCVFTNHENTRQLRFFVGRKYYQAPEDVADIDYYFTVNKHSVRFVDVVLNAPEGPFSTTDHTIRVAAMPVDNESVFLLLEYGYQFGTIAKLAMQGYLATLGRNKVGFTRTGVDGDGQAIFIGGMHGLVERNAMRYFLALQAYFSTLVEPAGERFEKRISTWFDLTQRYKRQLFEVEKPLYLDAKRRERENQRDLQRRLDRENI